MYDGGKIESQQQKKNVTPVEKAWRLHAIFTKVLQSYVECQRQGGLKRVHLSLGGFERVVDVKVPCCFIIGDMQGGDKICGRTVYYNSNAKRICRKCNVTGQDSGNPNIKCYKINMFKVMKLVQDNNQNILDEISQTNIHSAWFDVDYGGCQYGIFSAACPVEPLHALENGLISDCLQILFDILKGKQKGYCAQLDSLAQGLARHDRQRFFSAGSDPQMPRLIWKDGITSLTQIPARYKVGLMLTVVVLAQTEEGRNIFVPALQESAETNHRAARTRYNKMLYVFQMLLSYWSWLRQPAYWERGDKEARIEAKGAIRRMLQEICRLWPRPVGNSWNKPKFHEQLHVPDDIERNGAPINSHTSPTEHNHIQHVKRPAQTTQKRRAVFDEQLGRRIAERYTIDTAYQRMTFDYGVLRPKAPPRHSNIIPRHASTASYQIRLENGLVVRPGDGASLPTWISQSIVDSLTHTYGVDRTATELTLDIHTEYLRQGELLRAHPRYRGGTPWHDWAVFRWQRERGDKRDYNRSVYDSHIHYGDGTTSSRKHHYAPARLLGFVNGLGGSEGPIMAIAQSCSFSHKRQTVFTTQWQLEDTGYASGVYLIDVDAIVRPCLMVPIDKKRGIYQEVWATERWASEFLNDDYWNTQEKRHGR